MDIDAMLCDHAQVAESKLFIAGGGIDQLIFHSEQGPYPATFTCAGVVRIPWAGQTREYQLNVSVLTEDGHDPALPTGPDTTARTPVGGQMSIRVGDGPMSVLGGEQGVPFAFSFAGLPLMEAGRYIVQVSLDGGPVRALPFTVRNHPVPATGQ